MILRRAVFAVLLGVVLPWSAAVIISGEFMEQKDTVIEVEQEDDNTIETLHETQSNTESIIQDDLYISVLMDDGNIEQMELDEYLIGVVLVEMPADFELEALKAQAVVARTYAVKRHYSGGKHIAAAICTNSNCCQGYCSEKEYMGNGGCESDVERIRQAVVATHNQVLTYNGKYIDATYFSCSGGKTESALAVWGSEIPYLQVVESPGEENAAHYTDTVTFSVEDFERLLGRDLTGNPKTWIGKMSYTDGGGIDTVVICGEEYKGTVLRTLLGLRSTAFTMTANDATIIVTTKGFGHRVGMSQYGAESMAVNGNTYLQILEHYYRGVRLDVLNN